MKYRDEIAKLVSNRKKARLVNRIVLAEKIGEENLEFVRDAIKRVTWTIVDDAPRSDCPCFGCEVGEECDYLEHSYILDLENLDLMRSISGTEEFYEFISLEEDSEELERALELIIYHLEYHSK